MAARKWWRNDRAIYRGDDPEFEDDPQAHRVYRMEREFKGLHKASTLDEASLNEYAIEACRKFDVKNTPEIYIVNKRTIDIGRCNNDGIYLNEYRQGNCMVILLHEVAHWIHDDLHGDESEAHGPEWAWIYIELMDYFKLIPRWLFTQLFDKYGVKYS